ncbi:MAG: cysteine desulfurase NifS [Actinomycetota bacterium]|nr:cysteine desulfurase NifS [Actinomycetota bacterium]
MKRIYLDYAATTPIDPGVSEKINKISFELFGNPSSLHSFGREAGNALEESRKQIASIINARPDEIIFTSGGTESDNLAVKGAAFANRKKGNHIITSAIEHHAVHETCKYLETSGFDVTYIGTDSNGVIEPDEIKKALKKDTILISIMHANNEIGSIQPIGEIGKLARKYGIIFHTDAVQSTGHIDTDVELLNVDLLSASAHKFYGPKGVGFLYKKNNIVLDPQLHGGSQEFGLRASTQNLPGIAGMAHALEIAVKELNTESKRQVFLRDKLINSVLNNISNTKLNGHRTKRLPNNANFSFSFIEGEAILLSLDFEGIAASSGSACSSSSFAPSHVLEAIGLDVETARGSLRFSIGKYTTEEDIDFTIKSLEKIITKLRKMSPLCRS